MREKLKKLQVGVGWPHPSNFCTNTREMGIVESKKTKKQKQNKTTLQVDPWWGPTISLETEKPPWSWKLFLNWSYEKVGSGRTRLSLASMFTRGTFDPFSRCNYSNPDDWIVNIHAPKIKLILSALHLQQICICCECILESQCKRMLCFTEIGLASAVSRCRRRSWRILCLFHKFAILRHTMPMAIFSINMFVIPSRLGLSVKILCPALTFGERWL